MLKLDIEKYEMPFKERIDHTVFASHWELYIIIISTLIAITIASFFFYKKINEDDILNCIVLVISSVASLTLTVCLIVSFINATVNYYDMSYNEYDVQGTIVSVKDKDGEEGSKITFVDGVNKRKLETSTSIQADKGDKIKIVSDGKIPTANNGFIHDNGFIHEPLKAKDKIHVSIEKNNKWYNVDI